MFTTCFETSKWFIHTWKRPCVYYTHWSIVFHKNGYHFPPLIKSKRNIKIPRVQFNPECKYVGPNWHFCCCWWYKVDSRNRKMEFKIIHGWCSNMHPLQRGIKWDQDVRLWTRRGSSRTLPALNILIPWFAKQARVKSASFCYLYEASGMRSRPRSLSLFSR